MGIIEDVSVAADSLWRTGKVEKMGDNDLAAMTQAASKIILECGIERTRRYRLGLTGCDSLSHVSDTAFLKQVDKALSSLHLDHVPSVREVL